MIRKEDTEMDFTDKAVFGQQMGRNCGVGCGVQTEREREMTRVGEEGKGGVSMEVGAAKEWSSLS